MKMTTIRNFRAKLTNTQYIIIALLQAPILAVIVAMLTRFAPEEGYTIMDNKNLVSLTQFQNLTADFEL